MFCPNCSKIINDSSHFCQYCGTDIGIKVQEEGRSKVLQRNSKGMMLVIFGVVTVILLGVYALSTYQSDYEIFVKAWEQQNYSEAFKIYQNTSEHSDVSKIEEYVVEEVSFLTNEYYGEKISVEEFTKALAPYSLIWPNEMTELKNKVKGIMLDEAYLIVEDYNADKISKDAVVEKLEPYSSVILGEISELETQIQKNEEVKQAKAYYEDGKYPEALDLCRSILIYKYGYSSDFPTSDMAEAVWETARKSFDILLQQSLEEAEEYARNQEYEEAIMELYEFCCQYEFFASFGWANVIREEFLEYDKLYEQQLADYTNRGIAVDEYSLLLKMTQKKAESGGGMDYMYAAEAAASSGRTYSSPFGMFQ